MRQDKLQKHGNKIWICLLWVMMLTGLVLGSLVGNPGSSSVTAAGTTAPDPAFQVPPRPWTALGSTGTVDESALSLYASVSTEIGFKAVNVGKVLVARYNVTNTFDNNANPNQPGWRVPIDFTNNLYYVEVTLNRTAVPAALPRMFTLRLF